jgi:hypothetical protein
MKHITPTLTFQNHPYQRRGSSISDPGIEGLVGKKEGGKKRPF